MTEFDFGTVEEFINSKDIFSRVYFYADFSMRLYELVKTGKTYRVDAYDILNFEKVAEMTIEEFKEYVGDNNLLNANTWKVEWNNGFVLCE